jgi:hypothetical protein
VVSIASALSCVAIDACIGMGFKLGGGFGRCRCCFLLSRTAFLRHPGLGTMSSSLNPHSTSSVGDLGPDRSRESDLSLRGFIRNWDVV